MSNFLEKMSLSDLNLLKSLLENKLSAKENWVNAERGHNLHEYNRRYLEFKNDKDHERLKIVKEKINDIVSFPLIFDADNNLPSKDEIMNISYEKANYELRNWTIENVEGSYILRGQVYNCPNYYDGEWLITTNLKSIDFDKGIAETKNSIYKLEKN